MAKSRIILAATLLIAALPDWSLGKIGLESNLADIIIEKAQHGRSYNLREVNGIAFKIRNIGDAPVSVVSEVRVPAKKELKPGYEPIPDPSWVQIIPDNFTLRPQGNAFLDIILRIPDDPSLKNRHFQFFVWTHTKDTGFYGTGLEARIRFSLGKGPETLAEEKKRRRLLTFAFDLWPQTLYISKAVAGKRYDAKKQEKKSLRIINKAEEQLVLILKSVPWKDVATLPVGFKKAPDPSWLKLKKSEIKVKPLSIKDVPFVLEIPKGHEGKKYGFWIEPSLTSGLTFTFGSRIFVTVMEKEKK